MAITPKIEIRQSQSLLMTPSLRQAINILQMSNLELNELVEKELENNPLLEKEDDRIENFEPEQKNIDSYDEPQTPLPEDESPDIDYDNQFDDDFASDREGYENGNDYDWQDYSKSKGTAGEDFDYIEKKLSGSKSLYRFLEEQISTLFTHGKEKIIALHLTEFLDESGYFRGDIKSIAQKLNTNETEISNILSQLQTLEPSGIFATSLSQCLSIQLKDLNRYDPMIEKLLQNLELLAARKFKELKKICETNDEDLASMINDIKSLNPKPAANFAGGITGYVIPDVFVRTNKYGEYIVELNNMSLPRVLINREYYSEIKNVVAKDKQAKRYLKEQLGNAGFLVKAMHQRAVTMLRVSEEIVKTQRDFFEHGIEHLKPMALKDIAEAVEMHESTISRVTNNKFISTPRGIFELKYFFTQAAETYTGQEGASTLSIKHKIKKLIEEEDEKDILSDDRIVELMAAQGVKIARRTVNKYRESMGIPTSAERKRIKRNKL